MEETWSEDPTADRKEQHMFPKKNFINISYNKTYKSIGTSSTGFRFLYFVF